MSFKIEHSGRTLALGLASVSLLLWAAYLWSLSPAFPPDDSPETITACFGLGIQHPPGYPLHTLLGRLAVWGLPLGSPAWRVNLLSAALAVASAASLGALAWRLAVGLSPSSALLAALGASLSFGLWRVSWQQATEAKGGIYLLNLLLCAGAWHLGLSLLRGAGARAAALLGLLLGLALAHHYLSALLGFLPPLLALAWALRHSKLSRSALAGALLCSLPGLSLYLYLPLRSRFWPALDLGHPADWSGFWWTVLRKGYTQASTGAWADVAWDQARVVGLSLLEHGAWALAPLALWGAAWAWRRQRLETALWLGAGLLILFSVVLLNRTPADNRWLAQIFVLPFAGSLSVAAGLGLAQLSSQGRPWGLGPGALLALAALLFTVNAPWARRDDAYLGYDYARDLALSLPRGSLYLIEGDYHLMPLIYAREVEGRRRDVLPALTVLLGEPWYRATLQRQRPGLFDGLESASLPARIATWARRGPVVVSAYSELVRLDPAGPWHFEQLGLARGLSTAKPAKASLGYARAWRLRLPQRAWPLWDPVERQLLPWYIMSLVNTGNQAVGEGAPKVSELAHQMALVLPGDKPVGGLSMNLALALEAQGRPAEALAAAKRGRDAEPGFNPLYQLIQRLEAASRPR